MADTVAAVTVRLVAVEACCPLCGAEVRVEDVSDRITPGLLERMRSWLWSHRDPHLTRVEMETISSHGVVERQVWEPV